MLEKPQLNSPQHREFGVGLALAAVFLSLIPIGVVVFSHPRQADFAGFYASALILRQGHGAKLYDLNEQERVQDQLQHRQGLMLNPLPPFHAVLIAPFTWLGLRAGYFAWGLVNILLWALFYWLLRNEPGVAERPLAYLLLGCLFCPLWSALIQGQFSVFLLVGFTLAYVCVKSGRDYLGGLGLGIGMLKFAALVPFALIFLLRRKWTFMAGLATAAGLLAAVSLIAAGFTGVMSYLKLLIDMSRHVSAEVYSVSWPWKMPTIGGFVSSLLRAHISMSWIDAISACLSGSLILLTAWQWRTADQAGDRANSDLLFAAAVVLSLVTSPHLYAHDLTAMLLPFVIIFGSTQWKANSILRWLIVSATAILYASPLYLFDDHRLRMVYLLAPVLVAFALATLSFVRRGPLTAVPDAQGNPACRTLLPRRKTPSVSPTEGWKAL